MHADRLFHVQRLHDPQCGAAASATYASAHAVLSGTAPAPWTAAVAQAAKRPNTPSHTAAGQAPERQRGLSSPGWVVAEHSPAFEPPAGVAGSAGLSGYQPLPEACTLFARKFEADAAAQPHFFTDCAGIGLKRQCLREAARCQQHRSLANRAACRCFMAGSCPALPGDHGPAWLVTALALAAALCVAALLAWQRQRLRAVLARQRSSLRRPRSERPAPQARSPMAALLAKQASD